MKKSVLLIVMYLLISLNPYAQEIICGGIEGTLKSSILIPNSNDYIPNQNTPTQFIRVNVHFILLEQGTQGYPQNFTAVDDGNGNSNYTGFNYAYDLIERANYLIWSNHNTQMLLPPGNNTPTLDWKYYFTLNGVFFHENNTHHIFTRSGSQTDNLFGIDGGYAINLYLVQSDPNDNAGGVANMNGDRYVKICRAWEHYNNLGLNSSLHSSATIFLHETGHNLSLLHTMMEGQGDCSLTHDDFCSDTPTMGEIITNFGFDPCNNIWGCTSNCSNNMMDYSGSLAITGYFGLS